MTDQTPRREFLAKRRELDDRYGDDTGLPDAEHTHRDRMERIGTCPACSHNAGVMARSLRRRLHDNGHAIAPPEPDENGSEATA